MPGDAQTAGATAALPIEGMHSASCVHTIEAALSNVRGVRRCTASLGAEKAFVEYDPQQTSPQQMEQAVTAVGYRVASTELVLTIPEIRAAATAETARNQLAAMHGVAAVDVHHASARVEVDTTLGW